MRVYTIKYVLSTHRIEVDEVQRSSADERYVRGKAWYSTYRLGKDAFETEAEAIDGAEKMRARKLASIDKQRAKLVVAKFTVSTEVGA